MDLEIDVSGEDILTKDYTICLSDKKGEIILGFKFNNEIINKLCSRYGQGLYKHQKSQKGKAMFKVRLYCIVVFYLLKNIRKSISSLTLCRDFQGREKEIKETIFALLKKEQLNQNFNIYFDKLPNNSNAHKYAYLMRNDDKNKMNTYIKLYLEDIELLLKNKNKKCQ